MVSYFYASTKYNVLSVSLFITPDSIVCHVFIPLLHERTTTSQISQSFLTTNTSSLVISHIIASKTLSVTYTSVTKNIVLVSCAALMLDSIVANVHPTYTPSNSVQHLSNQRQPLFVGRRGVVRLAQVLSEVWSDRHLVLQVL